MYFKQINEIISGQKTQTRRLVKSGERLNMASLQNMVQTKTGRLKWQVGRDYAVQPGRGKPGVWWNSTTREWDEYAPMSRDGVADHWDSLRIRITDIRQKALHDIGEADARAEGCAGYTYYKHMRTHLDWTPREEYRTLWDSINTRKGTRWVDNPDVWCISFQVVR